MKSYKTPFVIAEIGCNHRGEMKIAKEMIKMAKIFGEVDAVKFQKRSNRELLSEEQYNSPHPNPMHSYGDTYGLHREYLEFSMEEHSELKAFCEDLDIIYSTSVWDMSSAREISSLNPTFIKIPSACNNHLEMLNWLCTNYKGQIHVSTGMSTKLEIQTVFELFKANGRNKDLVLYNCTSGYPVPFKDIALLEIIDLQQKYGKEINAIGFSGHHLGIAVDVAAYTLGASVVERHFTLDRTWKGTDHAASLEPGGLRKLKRDLMAVAESLTYKSQEILPIEEVQRKKLKFKTLN